MIYVEKYYGYISIRLDGQPLGRLDIYSFVKLRSSKVWRYVELPINELCQKGGKFRVKLNKTLQAYISLRRTSNAIYDIQSVPIPDKSSSNIKQKMEHHWKIDNKEKLNSNEISKLLFTNKLSREKKKQKLYSTLILEIYGLAYIASIHVISSNIIWLSRYFQPNYYIYNPYMSTYRCCKHLLCNFIYFYRSMTQYMGQSSFPFQKKKENNVNFLFH